MRIGLAAVGLAIGAGACGDALLPSDYAGPPPAAVSGNITSWSKGTDAAKYPVLSLEWLGAGEASSLHGQPVKFVRSTGIDNRWDIDLVLPDAPAKLERSYANGHLRFSVGKLVYFDDRAQDGRLDWRCIDGNCDLVKSVSDEFVVFLESAPTCRRASVAGKQLARGFHYFRIEAGQLRELESSESVRFTITDRRPIDSDPSQALRDFAELWLRPYSLDSLDGC